MASFETFTADVQRADGTLIPLTSPDELLQGLHIAVRHVQNPLQVPNSTASTNFFGWSNPWSWKGSEKAQTDSMVVDTYTLKGEGLTPVGHMDWWVLDEYANGGGNEHAAFQAQTEHEKMATERWDDSIAFKVDPKYHRRGLGSLMLATSALVLPALGATRFYTGCLLEPAKKTYSNFGIKEASWPRQSRDWSGRCLAVEVLTGHTKVQDSISKFV